jgi:uncharacterized DUF497 family protein
MYSDDAVAIEVFNDSNIFLRHDSSVKGEERWHAIGFAREVLILVVHTYILDTETEVIRIISARKPTPQETKAYEEGKN